MKLLLKTVLPVVVLAIGGLIAFAMVKHRRVVTPEARGEVLPVVHAISIPAREHRYGVASQGSVLPRTDIQLVAEVSGRVVAVSPSFAAGGFFEAGEVLVEIDPRDYELAVTRARAGLAEAEVRLQREEAEAEVARREWQTLGAGEPGALVLRAPQLAEARAGVDSARANLRLAERDLERCGIRAPFAGRVWSKKADAGQFLARGEPVGRVYAVDYAEVRLPLPLDETGYLDLPLEFRGESRAEGPKVTLKARLGGQTHEWEGRIVRTEGEIDARSRMLTAVARIDNPYARGPTRRPPLAVGLFVEAEIEGRYAGRVVLAPRAALRGDQRLMVVDAERRLRFRPVEILRFEWDRVVIGGGLRDGDLICVSPLEAPVEGMKVRLLETASSQPPGN